MRVIIPLLEKNTNTLIWWEKEKKATFDRDSDKNKHGESHPSLPTINVSEREAKKVRQYLVQVFEYILKIY